MMLGLLILAGIGLLMHFLNKTIISNGDHLIKRVI
jgi:hypothetical protein